jgi:hypothetical protein
LSAYHVVPLFSPKRRPQYNGGVERANGQLTGYQEAVAEFRGRLAGPTREDAATARQLHNELARPAGVAGPTAAELWAAREPISAVERSAFLATVAEHRAQVRAEWGIPPDEQLAHYPASAVDRRAVRDALLSHDLLRIHPRRRKRAASRQSSAPPIATTTAGAGILQLAMLTAPPMVGGALALQSHGAAGGQQPCEEARSSTDKSSASGQH